MTGLYALACGSVGGLVVWRALGKASPSRSPTPDNVRTL
jgi:hypothetical protein